MLKFFYKLISTYLKQKIEIKQALKRHHGLFRQLHTVSGSVSQSVSQSVSHSLSSTFNHFQPLSGTFITFIHIHPNFSYILIHFHPLLYTFIHVHPLSPLSSSSISQSVNRVIYSTATGDLDMFVLVR